MSSKNNETFSLMVVRIYFNLLVQLYVYVCKMLLILFFFATFQIPKGQIIRV